MDTIGRLIRDDYGYTVPQYFDEELNRWVLFTKASLQEMVQEEVEKFMEGGGD